MDGNATLLFDYLRDIIYHPASARLDPHELHEDFRGLGEGLLYFAQCLDEQRGLAWALSKGDLGVPLPPPSNELAAPLKALHASLRHIAWQSQQVAKGDYLQRIDFMGDFADAFNTMVKQLDARQRALEHEVERGLIKAKALEQSNSLLTSITYHIPQMIVVFREDDHDILYSNKSASEALASDSALRDKLLGDAELLSCRMADQDAAIVSYLGRAGVRYLSIHAYMLQWYGQSARALVFSDVSDDVEHVKELEHHAYQDNLTKLHNRYFGVHTLGSWVEEKRLFSLCFADLDNLKYVNDTYGHNEGDAYIKSAAMYLGDFSPDCVACRLGGDEFMVLAPGVGQSDMQARMSELYHRLLESSEEKPYECRISYGIVEVRPDNTLPANAILSLADERMYDFKRLHKKVRQR